MTNISESGYPPPSQSSSDVSLEDGFHGPRTNFFKGIRMRLAALEEPPEFGIEDQIRRGLFAAFIMAATLGLIIALVLQVTIGQSVDNVTLTVVIAPLTEEPSKALCILIIAIFEWKYIPNRRYGAALGAAAGFGFGVVESFFYILLFVLTNQPAGIILNRIVGTAFMHPVWSAFVGIGVFSLLAHRPPPGELSKSTWWLPWLFLIIGIGNHTIWNAVAVSLPNARFTWGYPYLESVLDLLLIFPPFAIMLRDFLGGHFNFQDFFQTLAEPSASHPSTFSSPPPPPSGT